MKLTVAQRLLRTHLTELGITTTCEFRFMEDRRFRFDLASERYRIAFEVDGGIWTGGHRRNAKIEVDHEKLNLAQAQGWRVFRFTNRQVLSGEAKEWVKRWL